MVSVTASLIVLCLCLLQVHSVLCHSYYRRVERIVGHGFDHKFDYQAIPDPTHGRVNYVDRETAHNLSLTYATPRHTFVLRGDSTTVLDPDGPGRNSVRIRSKHKYHHHVAVFDVLHAPEGCGTWPAIWETEEIDWPSQGEIDIYEGVNDHPPNAATLHTTSDCTMPEQRKQTGTPLQNDCDWTVNWNAGCGVAITDKPNSYGPAFNANGGGWFAVERTASFIKVWFWPRNSWNVPWDVWYGSRFVTPVFWGTPSAFFPNTQCDIEEHFGPNNIIINLTFCGDWAGNVYADHGCPGTCIDYVNNNPEAFRNAYFEINSIHIYE